MKNNKGFTLVEVLVSLTLMAAFLMSALVVMNTAVRVFANAQNSAHSQVVADTLLDTMDAEISGAAAIPLAQADESVFMIVSEDAITFRNSDGETERITMEQGRMKIYRDDQLLDQLYSDKVYQNLQIAELSFSLFDGASARQQVKISLHLTDAKERGNFTFTQIITCPIDRNNCIFTGN